MSHYDYPVGTRVKFSNHPEADDDTGVIVAGEYDVGPDRVWAMWDGTQRAQYTRVQFLTKLEYPETPTQQTPFPQPSPALPTDSGKRKEFPMYSGLLAYFPAALARVSNHSFVGNQKHNAGKPLQHARGVSGDHSDCIVRHLVDAAEHRKGSDGRIEELSALAWRALALLQEELELAGTLPAPGSTFDNVVPQ